VCARVCVREIRKIQIRAIRYEIQDTTLDMVTGTAKIQYIMRALALFCVFSSALFTWQHRNGDTPNRWHSSKLTYHEKYTKQKKCLPCY